MPAFRAKWIVLSCRAFACVPNRAATGSGAAARAARINDAESKDIEAPSEGRNPDGGSNVRCPWQAGPDGAKTFRGHRLPAALRRCRSSALLSEVAVAPLL